MHADVCWLLVTMASVSVPVAALAQGDTALAVYCAHAEAALRSGALGSEYRDAVTTLPDCPVDGAARLLAEQWTAPPRDSVALVGLAGANAMVLDQRVFEAARAVVANEGGLREARLAAMNVLVGHYDPCLGAYFQLASPPNAAGQSVAVWLLQHEHNFSRRGSVPLLSSVHDDVPATLDAAAASGPDSVVGEAARRLAARLRAFHRPSKSCG